MNSYQQKPPAKAQRGKRYGQANQIAYEQSERAERNATLGSMRRSKDAARKRLARAKTSSTTGMNAGTVGGSWLSSFHQPRK